MIQGNINDHEVLAHPITISRSFGFLFYLRCIADVLFSKKKRTFLELVGASPPIRRKVL